MEGFSVSVSLIIYLLGLTSTVLLLVLSQKMNVILPNGKNVQYKEGKVYMAKGFILSVVGFFPMWVLLAFRNVTVGNDTHGTYLRVYKAVLRGLDMARINTENGYFWLNKLVISLTPSYHLLLIVVGTISWLLFYSYICKYSENAALSIVFFFLSFFYFRQFNGMRQMLAESIALQGFRYIYERKFHKYAIFVLIAFMFHNSAIILLPLYFLYGMKLNARRIIGIVLGTKATASFFVSFFFPLILKGTKYYRIIFDMRAYQGGYWVSDIAISCFILLLCLIKIDGNDDAMFNFNTWLIVISAVLSLNSNLIPLVGRLLWYSYINLMVFIPSLFAKFRDKVHHFWVVVSTFTVYGAFFYQQWSLGVEGVTRYSFWH